MLKITYESGYYIPYVIGFLISVVAGLLIAILLKLRDIYGAYLLGAVIAFTLWITLFSTFSALDGRGKASYIAQIEKDEIPYFTYGKCDIDFETALMKYGGSGQSSIPLVIYDVKEPEEEWNEIRKVETAKYTFIAYVRHLSGMPIIKRADSSTDTVSDLATPSYVDPRNKVQ